MRVITDNQSLDLTSASRVYLMEPHWNPMVEEQALCRVHRVGQRREVTTIRYLIRDSFEEVTAIFNFFRDLKSVGNRLISVLASGGDSKA